VGLFVLVAAFLMLGWWQLSRAVHGNLLSYGYAIQWPAFALFAIWVWLTEVRKARRTPPAADDSAVLGHSVVDEDQSTTVTPGSTAVRARRVRNEAAYDDSDDPELAAYNHYLAWCNAHPYASPADYPGPPSKELTS
jgi:hypothetical protein